MENELIHYGATICFALAILHTFSVKFFQKYSHKYPSGSARQNALHILGEVEIVFGLWAGVFILFFMSAISIEKSISYLEGRNFAEPLFVFVIMVVCASQPILKVGESLIGFLGRQLPFNKSLGFFIATLSIGPLLGSFITEPAAMTLTSLILLKNFYERSISEKLRYATLGLLFVNVSIGGVLTPYSAPPILMVAPQWGWDISYMLFNFGWKAALAIALSTSIVACRFRKEISSLDFRKPIKSSIIPTWVSSVHMIILMLIVLSSHHPVLFAGLFLFFLGIASVTKEHQSELKIRESLLVSFFLGGLVVLGGYQSWWLTPFIHQLTALPLYLGAISLTAFTDNAAITYLGGQVPHLTDISKYALVAGSVVGGGLTVIANAPNPAGYSTLNPSFGIDGINPFQLFRSALLPTCIAGLCFWLL